MRSVECGVRSVQCKVLSVECKVWSVKCVDLRFVGQAQYFRSFSSPCDCILFLDVACVRSSNCVLHVTAASRIVRAVSKFSWMSFACAVFCVSHMTTGPRIVRAVYRCSWTSLACVVISCFASVRRQSHCNCNANGVHVSIFLILTAFIFL